MTLRFPRSSKPGYWMLVPAYFSLWAGGMWLAKQEGSIGARIGKLAFAVVASVAVCQLFSQGGFYWLSDAVANKTVAAERLGRDVRACGCVGEP